MTVTQWSYWFSVSFVVSVLAVLCVLAEDRELNELNDIYDPLRFETDDAVIVVARSFNETVRSRELVVRESAPLTPNRRRRRQYENWITPGEVGACFTERGLFGKCMSFKKCYPFLKLPQLSNQQTWVFGMFDTCTYFTAYGKQSYGVCCPEVVLNPIFQIAPDDNEKRLYNKPLRWQSPAIPNDWPPPIPTHPPDHTIPPLPTHPPSYPGGIQQPTTQQPPVHWPPKPPSHPPIQQPPPSWPPQQPPTQYPTVVPPNWPPPIPTHPPSPAYPTYPGGPPEYPSHPGAPPEYPSHPGAPPEYPSHPGAPPSFPTHPALPPSYPTYPTPEAPEYPSLPTTEKPVSIEPAEPPSDLMPDYNNNAQCGLKNGLEREEDRIVGGQNARPGEWPWIAALMNGGRQFCGGSLLDSTHVLTAAHCVAHMSSWDVAQLSVNLGDHNIKSSSDVRHVEKRVKRIVRHKGFDPRTLYNDVAIITLDSPVTYTRTIRSICLPSGNKGYAGKTATVIGWGSLRESGPQPAILQKVNIPVWTNQECKEKYGPAAPGGITETMLCAGQTAQDSCSGDSGGPLMIEEGQWTQVGIVSWGIGCGKGQYPGVYTRVTHFMPWIKKNLKP